MPHAVEKTQSGDRSTHQEIGPGQFRPEKIAKVKVTVRLVCRPPLESSPFQLSYSDLTLQNDIRPFNQRTEPPTSYTLERWLNEQTREEYYHGQGNRIERLWN